MWYIFHWTRHAHAICAHIHLRYIIIRLIVIELTARINLVEFSKWNIHSYRSITFNSNKLRSGVNLYTLHLNKGFFLSINTSKIQPENQCAFVCLCNDYTYPYLIIYCLWYYVVYWCMRMWMWMCSRSIERSIQYNYTMLSLNGIACREFYRFPLNKPLFEWEKNATQRSILQGHREMHSTADYWEKKNLKMSDATCCIYFNNHRSTNKPICLLCSL